MDWLTFLSNTVASLAWPIVLVVLVLLLRKELGALVVTLRRLKWKDLEAEFGQELKELENAAKNLPPAETEPTVSNAASGPGSTNGTTDVQAIARLSPSAAVLTSWINVEEAIGHAVRRLSISADAPWHLSPLRKIELLQEWTDIDNDTVAVLHRLRELRNRAAHFSADSPAISTSDAIEYHDAALRAATALRRIHHKPRANDATNTDVSNPMSKQDETSHTGY
jgi:hypothetical protein